jgi:hypothetical protein
MIKFSTEIIPAAIKKKSGKYFLSGMLLERKCKIMISNKFTACCWSYTTEDCGLFILKK